MWPNLDPRGMITGFIKGSISHCYTQNIKPLGFVVSEKKIFFMFFFFFYVSLGGLMTPGAKSILPPGHDWQDLCRVLLNIVTY